MKDPLFTFDDIVVPDADDIMGPSDEVIDETEAEKSVWNSGKKENIWRGVQSKDIWTADPNGNTEEKEAWSSEEDNEEHQESDGAFGDIF